MRTVPEGRRTNVRHMLSLLLGLVIAPVVWIAAGTGQAKLAQVHGPELGLRSGAAPVAVLVTAGLIFGLVAATRISPIGPVAAGLFLLGGQLAYVARPGRVTTLLPERLFGTEGVFTLPAKTGLAAVLGATLLVTLVSVGRWRRWPATDRQPDQGSGETSDPLDGLRGPVVGGRDTARPERSRYEALRPLSGEPTRQVPGPGGAPGAVRGPGAALRAERTTPLTR